MVAATAYSGLWLSERIAEARSGSCSRTSQAAIASGEAASWSKAAGSVPGGDPRRVLASRARMTRAHADRGRGDTVALLRKLPWAPIATLGASP